MAKGISFNLAKDIPSLAGKVLLITGRNLRLGKQTAIELAKHSPSELWLAARSADSGHATVAEIRKASPDVQFGINHMGHALLFKLLKPLLLKTASIPGADVRTITLSSAGHRFGKKELLLESMKRFSHQWISTVIASWLMPSMLMLWRSMCRRLPPSRYTRETSREFFRLHRRNRRHMLICCLQTELFSSNGGSWMITFLRNIVVPLTSVSVEEGVKNQLWAGTAKGVENGLYYEPIGVTGKASPQAQSDELAKKLYDWTEKELEGHEL
ncbi:hypothetical protein HYFRA_00001212 [Hymenoscyphus fraxineus]|uniref:Uncharacterized protein n=1 Tax=Hymenoscyphus fraxineus TaxID=746836 RepID=A0A9N9KQX1_9HELO|nr:hypothetical protein HYFRA_00001212 [Hymenoscyphus fraxineus]